VHEGAAAAFKVCGTVELETLPSAIRDSLSWDMQDLGRAAETTYGKNRYLLTVMCEFTSFVELYMLCLTRPLKEWRIA
jgi:hypothetical protein